MTAPLADVPLATVAAALVVYPVKGCAGVAVDALALDARGGAHGDRRWAIVDEQGHVTWQGSHPRLALVRPEPRGPALALHAPGAAPLGVDAQALRPCTVAIWNDATARHDDCAASDAGPTAAAWLRALTGAGLRLVRLGDAACARPGANALHIVFGDSAAAIDAALAARGHAAADVARYRPNIVLRAAAGAQLDPFIEDFAQALAWRGRDGDFTLDVTAPCVRCVVPNVDPGSAEVGTHTLRALEDASQARRPGGPTTFGIYAQGPAGARLRVGDEALLELRF